MYQRVVVNIFVLLFLIPNHQKVNNEYKKRREKRNFNSQSFLLRNNKTFYNFAYVKMDLGH